MTALLEALRRIETQRASRPSVAESPAPPTAAASASTPSASAAEPVSIPPPRREAPVAPSFGEPPLNARATVAADVLAAAGAIAHRFRAPALVALVTCSDAADDVEIVAEIGAALESLGRPTTIFGPEGSVAAVYDLAAMEELRAGRGYHLLHTTIEAAMEQTPLLGAADGVLMLVELERTPIQDAESAVGRMRREAIAVSGILLIA